MQSYWCILVENVFVGISIRLLQDEKPMMMYRCMAPETSWMTGSSVDDSLPKKTGHGNLLLSQFLTLISQVLDRWSDQVRPKTSSDFSSVSIPIRSMYGIVTYIWLIFYGKCREIYHTWSIWDRASKILPQNIFQFTLRYIYVTCIR